MRVGKLLIIRDCEVGRLRQGSQHGKKFRTSPSRRVLYDDLEEPPYAIIPSCIPLLARRARSSQVTNDQSTSVFGYCSLIKT